MIRFIWRNWWRHKQRFILLLVGILIISSGLTFLSSLTESNLGTVTDTLEKNWKASYDIVVRPPGTRSMTEEDKLFEPNFLSGIGGGISMQQYERIKTIPDVDIAAPLAVMGNVEIEMVMDKVKIPDMGVYRMTEEVVSDSGVYKDQTSITNYFTKGAWNVPRASENDFSGYEQYGVYDFFGELRGFESRLLVGIDPEQEARLVGLDQAVLQMDGSRYFRSSDESRSYPFPFDKTVQQTRIPILISSEPFVDSLYRYRIERLDLPFQTAEEAKQTMEKVKQNGGKSYLDTIKPINGEKAVDRKFDTKQAYEVFVGNLTGKNPYTGAAYENEETSVGSNVNLYWRSSSLQFEKAASPFSEQWKFAFRVKPAPNESQNSLLSNSYRMQQTLRAPQDKHQLPGYLILPNWIGFYDPNKLNISKDPTSQTPLETYRSSFARLVLQANGNPVNPPNSMQATMNPLGLLTSPPTLLTTIDGATKVLGDKAISAIRIKVSGVNSLSADNQAKVAKVAKDIERETGLIADVIFGSAPQPVLVDVPQNGETPALGWMEQTWMKIGESTGLFNETHMGFSVIMLLILLVAVLYVQATQIVSLLMRRREFAVLLAVGWRPSKLKRMIVQEAFILGVFASFVSGALGLAIWLQNPNQIAPIRIAQFASLGLAIYVLGSLWPAWLTGKIRPHETMRTGEIAKAARRIMKSGGIVSMALNHFLGKIGRYTLSILSIALPTALLVLLLFITFRLKGVLYTSWIGQYISVQIGPQHYVAIAVTLVICVLTTAELIWQNVTERKPELFLLKSIGWRSGAVRKLILYEGWVCGLLAGVIGYVIGLIITGYMYGAVPWSDALLLLPVCGVPMIIGLIAAWVPAEIAVRGFPAGTTRTIYSSSKRTERWFFAAATVFGLVVLAVAGKAVYDYLPKLMAANAVQEAPVTNMIKEQPKTIGKLINFEPQTQPNGSKAQYDISLEMKSSGQFTVKTAIDVSNVSPDAWDKVVFYMIPNAFTAANKPAFIKGTADFQIQEVKLNGKKTSYDLRYDTLTVPLADLLQPNAQSKVEVTYSFTVPEPGNRFSKDGDNYFLAQFYPMLATYNKGWNKEDYMTASESYFTDISDFRMTYKVPPGYTVISSADDEPDTTPATATFEAKRVKELFVALVKQPVIRKNTVEGTDIRVFAKPGDEAKADAMIEHAGTALRYLQQTIGIYPRKQLDILLMEGGMEYPGIVTATNVDDPDGLRYTMQHEIAHQWFYGVVSNDPYHEGFLDEGFTEFSASLLRMDQEGLKAEDAFRYMQEHQVRGKPKPSNLSLPEYENRMYPYLYAQPTMKLWELFSKYDGIQTAKAFLKAYYGTYANKQVDTKEFVRFTKAYFLMEDDDFFKSWLKLQ